MRASAENAAALDAVLADMSDKVRECEPGVAWYSFAKDAQDPNTYVVIEVYRDEAAFWAHSRTEHIKALLPKSAALVEGGSFEIRQYVSPGTRPVRPMLTPAGVKSRPESEAPTSPKAPDSGA
jgi:quinol monooxygenase YgiN